MRRFKKDDEVMVITGRDKGKKSKIISLYPKESKAICENINLVTRHMKQTDKVKGGRVKMPAKIDLSNIMPLDSSGNPSRVTFTRNKKDEKQVKYVTETKKK